MMWSNIRLSEMTRNDDSLSNWRTGSTLESWLQGEKRFWPLSDRRIFAGYFRNELVARRLRDLLQQWTTFICAFERFIGDENWKREWMTLLPESASNQKGVNSYPRIKIRQAEAGLLVTPTIVPHLPTPNVARSVLPPPRLQVSSP